MPAVPVEMGDTGAEGSSACNDTRMLGKVGLKEGTF